MADKERGKVITITLLEKNQRDHNIANEFEKARFTQYQAHPVS
ncbi:hypothetical protein PUND_a3087 [Pseudoalteromonas undina]|nr:hypothetical protein PUND_a3087 [Pseudoalteromonas undina]